MPLEAPPPFDHEKSEALNHIVVIPAAKYPKFAAVDGKGCADFLGWAGRLVGYENSKKKMKVKISGDVGLEHLSVSDGKYAINVLQRLT